MFCTGCGSSLSNSARFCSRCGKLAPPQPAPPPRPLPAAGLTLQPGEYEHPSMQSVNRALRQSKVFNAVAEQISRKVGRRWYESTFNTIPVSAGRYPRLHELMLVACARFGLGRPPQVFIEADRPYASATYGSQEDAFVNVGSFLPRLLNDRELLFVVGHEFGHLLGNHALWMTVSNFAFGEQRSNLMSEGLFGLLNPVRLVTAGVESLVTNWMRVADFTADRAGLLAVGDFEVARRALFLMYLKNRAVLAEVNLDEWMSEQQGKDVEITKVSQLMSSGAPYLGLRIAEMKAFHESAQYKAARDKVEATSLRKLEEIFDAEGFLRSHGKPGARPAAPPPAAARPTQPAARKRLIRGACPHCRHQLTLRVDESIGKSEVSVACPSCRKAFPLPVGRILGRDAGPPTPPTPAPPPSGPARPAPRPAPAKPTAPRLRAVRGRCPRCQRAFAIPLAKLPRRPYVDVKCKNCGARRRLGLTAVQPLQP